MELPKGHMEKKLFLILLLCGLIFGLITVNPLFNVFSFSGLRDKELAITYGTLVGGFFWSVIIIAKFLFGIYFI
jgi:hypothetical protein